MKLSVLCSLALLGSMATAVDARAQSPAPALTIYWAGAQMSPSGRGYSEVTSTRLVVRAR